LGVLNGRVALVAGGSRGIGKSIVIALAETGADVAANYLKAKDEAEPACHQIESTGRQAMSVGADASKETEVCAYDTPVPWQAVANLMFIGNGSYADLQTPKFQASA
jgi:NAD(P)-dependent dehydrogenase (short-subunit alcohol dehydrogenase family)